MNSENKIGAVMVVGAGIGGIQASLDIAELGFKVYLIEREPSIGGIMAKLDKTFPTNDCSLCILAPKMVEAFRHPNIELHAYANVEKIEGEAGNFEVTILKKARAVEETKCKSCSECTVKCPVKVPDEYNGGLNMRKAIHITFPQAVPSCYLIDKEKCLYFTKEVCQLCEKNCNAGAINYKQKDELVKLKVGAIILSTGAEPFDPSNLSQYKYGKYKNVLTSIEFERILNASGPFKGKVLRPSDESHPKKILWVNCIGSRNTRLNQGYCSAVCCMYSIKESVMTKEHEPDIDCHIHFIDMRAVGKNFEEYYFRAQNIGVNFKKSRISTITEVSGTNDLMVTYENLSTGEIISEIFDIVVLSVGLKPSDQSIEVASKFGIKLDKYNFCATNLFAPLETSRNGVYVCGTFSGPKDIPETVAEASGAAAKASSLLYTERNTNISEKIYPPELPDYDQEPRIGVFVCHCGINIGSVVNVPEVVAYAKTLPHVIHAEENLYSCSQDAQERIKQTIKDHGLNRVVIASCTPRTHEILFQSTIREAGLNPYLFELANIREQCSWVHMNETKEATRKAKDLVAMNVSKANLLEPIHESSVDVKKACLVIGGGIAGLSAALEVANQGFKVYLIEKSIDLGGNAAKLHDLLGFGNPQIYIQKLIYQVVNHKKIKVIFKASIDSVEGFIGNYRVALKSFGKSETIDVGTIIVATGGKEYKPTEYKYGLDDRIMTQMELEENIASNKINPKDVVMIQCVGSRNQERPNCSKICCTHAIKNALRLKERNPDVNVSILHRDIRTCGTKEDYYREAREKGVIFIRFDKSSEPKVDISNNRLSVIVKDSLSGNELLFKPDIITLSSAFIPAENEDLSKFLKVPIEQNGFFLEAHVKLRPLDFATDGIFLCGGAQWPKFINETIAQSQGAAARACAILSKEKLKVLSPVAEIDEDKCIGCGECRDICIYDAIERIETVKEFKAIRDSPTPSATLTRYKSKVRPALCKGCGTCVGGCPVGALSLKHFTNSQLSVMIETYLTQRS
ncbi:MAG: FAD-dependent oxidoreductase [Candidatus Hodarchaeota archaeon]